MPDALHNATLAIPELGEPLRIRWLAYPDVRFSNLMK